MQGIHDNILCVPCVMLCDSLRRSRLPPSLRHSMPGAGTLRRSRLPPSLRHSMPVARATVAWNLRGLPWNSLRAAGCAPPASFHAGCQCTRSVESPWLSMEFIAGSRLLLSRSRLRLYRQISIAHTRAFIGEHQSTTHLCALCALCARKKVGSVKSEVGSEVGSMTERHFYSAAPSFLCETMN